MDYDQKKLMEELISHVAKLARQVERIADQYAPERRGGGFAGCVVAGQMVATPDGAVPVEQVCKGITVLCYDSSTGKTEVTEVRSHREAIADEYLLINGELALTGVHEIYSADRGWIPASTARLGEPLQTVAGLRTIETAQLIRQPTPVYALEVGLHSCFFASGYLVHNKA